LATPILRHTARADFPQAKVCLLYLGHRRWHDRGVKDVPQRFLCFCAWH